MTGPEDPAAAGRGRIRAGHADGEQVIEALKNAFVQGRLTRDKLDARAGRALDARTRADLAALTADIPVGPAVVMPACPPAPARRRPLARAAAGSGGCLVIAFAAVWVATFSTDTVPEPHRRTVRTEQFEAASRGELQMVMHELLPLEQAVLAHQKMDAGEVFGRIVLVPSGS